MPLVGALSVAARDHLVERWSSRYMSQEVVEIQGRLNCCFVYLQVHECNWVCATSACGVYLCCQRRVGQPRVASENYAPVSLPGRLDPCLPAAVAAAAAVVAAAALSSFGDVSKCTMRTASSPNCSNVTSKIATNSSATNDVYDSGHMFGC